MICWIFGGIEILDAWTAATSELCRLLTCNSSLSKSLPSESELLEAAELPLLGSSGGGLWYSSSTAVSGFRFVSRCLQIHFTDDARLPLTTLL